MAVVARVALGNASMGNIRAETLRAFTGDEYNVEDVPRLPSFPAAWTLSAEAQGLEAPPTSVGSAPLPVSAMICTLAIAR
jgi:hypothetical protein